RPEELDLRPARRPRVEGRLRGHGDRGRDGRARSRPRQRVDDRTGRDRGRALAAVRGPRPHRNGRGEPGHPAGAGGGGVRDSLGASRTWVDGLAALVRPLDDATVAGPASPADWTIADVVSHLGSGAIIWTRRVDDALEGTTMPDDFSQRVWDEWNAKSPRAK